MNSKFFNTISSVGLLLLYFLINSNYEDEAAYDQDNKETKDHLHLLMQDNGV